VVLVQAHALKQVWKQFCRRQLHNAHWHTAQQRVLWGDDDDGALNCNIGKVDITDMAVQHSGTWQYNTGAHGSTTQGHMAVQHSGTWQYNTAAHGSTTQWHMAVRHSGPNMAVQHSGPTWCCHAMLVLHPEPASPTCVQLSDVFLHKGEGWDPLRPCHDHASPLGVQPEVVVANAVQPLKLLEDGSGGSSINLHAAT
jgi:hypothetical protein